MLTVPSAEHEFAGEVAFLYADLDEIERGRNVLLASARADAAQAERAAAGERIRLVAEARKEGERRAETLLVARRARAEAQIRAMLAEADREAARVRARGRERTPMVVAQIVERLLEDAQ
jgi:hypothetical protein